MDEELNRLVDYCWVCSEPIYEDQDFYGMPDGAVICAETECLQMWADEYKVPGVVTKS